MDKEKKRKYMFEKYHNDKEHREKMKKYNSIRVKALNILGKKYNKELKKIMEELK